MRVAYLAKHDSGGSDDEGAIVHAFEALGHKVDRLREARAKVASRMPSECDFLLFHHLRDLHYLEPVKLPKVFWCFDLIQYPDPTLAARNATRLKWVREATAIADLGFLTDGDHVAHDRTGKLHWLPQGADERVVGVGKADDGKPLNYLLFTGIGERGGKGRGSFVEQMRHTYGSGFVHVERGVYRRDLADLIAQSKIVLAPDEPTTSAYWSNRIYNALGFGAFLLHPYCERLAEQYQDGEDLRFYRSRTELLGLIEFYRDRQSLRLKVASNGLEATQQRHLYRHRVEQLCAVVKERLRL